ncbi:DUF5452 domain-containing protein [Mycoplasma sp. E35C]|uniref:DUF5452 domain-containing protein n=1 Tax=Mycoplasma sp. E35C TaxID=2801918 RepID=UPI001CA3F33E|nr:DUF5452 domain-containing protein [Mycoplasma sp. E35C]QZX49334.1 DUF5452 domain-containing protein [Mycoplasma sp. E35C]
MNKTYKKITIALFTSFLFLGTIGLAVATYLSSTKSSVKEIDDKKDNIKEIHQQNKLIPPTKKYPLENKEDNEEFFYYYVNIHQHLHKINEFDNLINYRDYLYQDNNNRPFSGFDVVYFQKNIKSWIYKAIRSHKMFRNNNDDIYINIDYFIENPSRSISLNVTWSFKKPIVYEDKNLKYWDQFLIKVKEDNKPSIA